MGAGVGHEVAVAVNGGAGRGLCPMWMGAAPEIEDCVTRLMVGSERTGAW